MKTSPTPSQDVEVESVDFDLDLYRHRADQLRFAAATFFSNDAVSLQFGMEQIRKTYPEGRVPVPA